MDFDTYYQENSFESEQQNVLDVHLSKTKTITTKFFTELNKHQKILNKRGNHLLDQYKNQTSKKQPSKQKIKKRSPTLKQMLMVSKKNLSQLMYDNQPDINNSGSRKKVRFHNKQDKFVSRTGERKTSLQKMASFNFCETIKQMALELTQSRKQQKQTNAGQLGQNTNDSLFTGYTQKEFSDGTKFKGICEKGVIIKGQLHFENGFIYDGELFLDKFHGKGKLILPKNQIIEADWVEGQIVGKSTIKYPKGQIYYGDLKNYRRHGNGHLFFKDGSKYEGDFNEGQLTGFGVYIAISGQKTSGYWFYGDFVGTNEQVFENVMHNISAHQKKKIQKQNKNNPKLQKSSTKLKSSVKGRNIFNQLIVNLNRENHQQIKR